MGTNLIRAMLLASASAAAVVTFAPIAVYAQEASYQIDIPSQSMGDALRALGKATKQNVVFNGSIVKGKRSAPVRGRMGAREALEKMLAGSGLEMARGSGGGLVVKAGNGSTSASQVAATTEHGSTVVASGQVIDELTGARLKGALVEIIGTDRSTSTDDLGTFRFSGLAPGSYNIRINYLGYVETVAPFEARRGAEAMQFALRGGSETREIVVIGRRSARAQSLNEERTAQNSTTVLASDFLGQFDGDTISEAMRRAPGIAFEQDEVTGDGTNVIVRGLAPDLNTVTFNGLRLPDGSGTERSASLGNILTDSIAKITINKTLLPSHDSSGTGGLIEIETKGPLDRSRRFANFSISGNKRGSGFREGFLASGTVSATFGAQDNFGLSASVQYREQDIKRVSYAVRQGVNSSEYLPLAANGTPVTDPFFIDPRTAFPFDPGVDGIYTQSLSNSFNGASSSNLTMTVSGQWKIANHTVLRADYTRADDRRDSFTRSATVDALTQFELMPVDELGGEVRAALVAEDIYAPFGLPGVLLSTNQNAALEQGRKDITQTLSFQGETNVDAWKFNYTFGLAKGRTTVPFIGQVATLATAVNVEQFLLPEALANVTSTGRVISPFPLRTGSGFPLPLLTQAGFDAAKRDRLSSVVLASGNAGENERYTVNLSGSYNFENSFLKNIEAGIFYEKATFKSPPILSDNVFGAYPANFANPPLIADVGLGYAGESLADIGLNGGFDVLALSDVRSLMGTIRGIAVGNPNFFVTGSEVDGRLQDAFTKEGNSSAYLQTHIEVGKLGIVGGVRMDRIALHARNLTGPSIVDENNNIDQEFAVRNRTLFDQKITQNTLLPRVAATYRQSDNLLIRAGFAITVARPRIQDLSDQSTINLFLRPVSGPNSDQPALFVQQGNPNLQPARTQNFDLSIERYFADASQIKISFFYKSISNLLEQTSSIGTDSLEGVELPNDPRFNNLPSNIFIAVTKPVNSPDRAQIWGAEVALEKQFTFLPGALSGFGVFANYTYAHSSKTQPLIYYDPNTFEQLTARIRGVPFTGAPKHSGTVALTYNKYGIDATLAYTTQVRRLSNFAAFNLSEYQERDETLDLRAEYRMKGAPEWRFWIEASDLLKGPHDPDVETSIGGTGSTPKFYTGGNYYGGRSVSLGVAMSFN